MTSKFIFGSTKVTETVVFQVTAAVISESGRRLEGHRLSFLSVIHAYGPRFDASVAFRINTVIQ